MRAVVLAGGYATRMWPITRNRPKMFLPVGDGTIIDEIFRDLEADDRIEEVFISTNERFADDFRRHIAESGFEKPTLSVEDTSEEGEKFGVVGALAQLVEREGIDDDLLVVAGDNLISFSLSDFVDYFEGVDGSALAAYDVGSRERAKSYGVLDVESERVVGFEEKPEDPQSTLASIACYAFERETVPLLGEYLSDDNNPDEPGWFVKWLQAREAVYAYTFDGAWYDIGTPAAYLDAVEWSLDGGSEVAADATVEDSDIGEAVHVMAGATVRNSTLERTVVFPDATVENCSFASSVIDEHAELSDIERENALVGGYTRIN